MFQCEMRLCASVATRFEIMSNQNEDCAMIYLLRTLWVLFYIPVFLLEFIAFLLGVIIYPLVVGIAHIKTGEHGNFYSAIMAEYIEKEYDKLKEQIEKQK